VVGQPLDSMKKTSGILLHSYSGHVALNLVISLAIQVLFYSGGWAADFKGVTIGLPAPSWSTRLPIAVAERGGFFKAEGVEVRSVVASGGPLMMALLMSGQAEMAMSGANAVVRAISRGAPIVIVGGVRNKLDYALMGVKGLKTVDDLRGKLVGVTGVGSLGEFVTLESLKRNGLVRDRDYTVLYVEGGPAARMAVLRTGRVAAVPLTPGQRVVMQDEGFPIVLDVGKAIPELPSTVLVSTQNFAKSNPNAVTAVLRALDKSMALIRHDKDTAVQIGKAYGLRGEASLERRALDYYAEDFNVRLRREGVAALLKLLEIKGDPSDFFTESFLEQAITVR
jgi:ABC-type nitrate/sulfonate/bicarbonate transport system substrate-binding protein